MIVRIMEEDQYTIDDSHAKKFEQLDQALLSSVHGQGTVEFHKALTNLHHYIRQHGQKVPHTEIVPSDLVVPAVDMTLAEAKDLIDAQPQP